jgi:hypothetical protein
MSEIIHGEDDSSDELTSASWRGKFYGIIREGHKTRVAPWFLKAFFGFLALIASVLQLISGFKPELQEKIHDNFGIPPSSSTDERLNVPLYDATKDDRFSNYGSGRKLKMPVIQGIQRIRLTTVKGIPTGSEASAILTSGATNGTVVAKLTQDLMADGEVLLPVGTLLFGRGASSDERLFIRFRRAILADKTEIKVKAQAFDSKDRMVGLKGKKMSDVAFKIAASSGLIFLGGLADGMKKTSDLNIYGQTQKPSIQDAALNGIATANVEQGRELMNSMKNSESRVEVKVETPIVVVFGDEQETEN